MAPAGRTAVDSYKALRERLVQEGKIVEGPSEGLLEVKEDIALGSPSAAAAILAGCNMNGRVSWKTKTGTNYQEWVDSSA